MKWFQVALMGAAMLGTTFAWQQSPSAKPSVSGSPSEEPQFAGTEVVVELSHSIDARKAKLGSPVKAVVTQDVLAHGKVVIRLGSKIWGHVSEIKLRTKDDQESRLGLIFDKAVLKGGEQISFVAAIRALAPAVQLSSVDRPDLMPPPYIPSGPSAGSPQPVGATTHRNVNSNNTGTNTGNAASQMGQIGQVEGAPGSSGSTNGVIGGGTRGVFGLPGLRLVAEKGPEHATVITSNIQNVKLESGTQVLIQLNILMR